eukprot:m.52351 g.52351  ORF g.52351 m.52351 type:complete len:77 (-) comp21586_c1_seq1:89-319(-)
MSMLVVDSGRLIFNNGTCCGWTCEYTEYLFKALQQGVSVDMIQRVVLNGFGDVHICGRQLVDDTTVYGLTSQRLGR